MMAIRSYPVDPVNPVKNRFFDCIGTYDAWWLRGVRRGAGTFERYNLRWINQDLKEFVTVRFSSLLMIVIIFFVLKALFLHRQAFY